MNTIANLWEGRAGLAKTYWLWGALSGIPWGLALSLVTPGSILAILAILAFVTYYVVVHVGIWRAASQYQGSKVWAILAKVAVAMTPACLVIGTLAAIIIPAMHQPPRQGQQTTSATQPLGQSGNPPASSSLPPCPEGETRIAGDSCAAATPEDPYASVADSTASVRYVPILPSTVPPSGQSWEQAADTIIEAVGVAAKRRALAADIYYEAKRAGLEPTLILSMVEVLSRFDAARVGSPRNIGLLQLDPELHVRLGNPENSLFQAKYNLRLGVNLLRLYLGAAQGDLYLALQRFLREAAPQGEPELRLQEIMSTRSTRLTELQ